MRSKSRLVAVIASVCVCAAMVGTGFASWVILAEKSEGATGNVKAEAVKDGSIEFTVDPKADINIYFGGPTTQETSGAWIYSDKQEGTEQLSVDFTLSITGKVGTIDITLANSGLQAAIEAGYITNATFTLGNVTNTGDNTDVKEASHATLEGNNKLTFGENGAGYEFNQGKVVVTMTYSWGAAFGEENPYTFFNGKNRNATVQDDGEYSGTLQTYYSAYAESSWAEAAKGVLGDLHTKLGTTSGIEMTVTFTAHQAS